MTAMHDRDKIGFRFIRQMQCGYKHKHKSFGAAEAHRRSLGADGERRESYWCRWCRNWHVGKRVRQWQP